MNMIDDIKEVSDRTMGRIAAQFQDLPRPLLAAIGAGDLAVERLAKLRQQLSDALGLSESPDGKPSADEVKDFAADLPDRARKIASDVAAQLQQFAAAAPEKAQRLIGELPAKTAELKDSLSPEKLRETVEGYTQFVGNVYATLADRGDETVSKVRPDDDADKADATPKAETKPKADAKPKAESEPKAETKPKAAGTAKPKAESEPKAAGTAKSKAGARAASKPKTASKPKAPAKTKVDDKTQADTDSADASTGS